MSYFPQLYRNLYFLLFSSYNESLQPQVSVLSPSATSKPSVSEVAQVSARVQHQVSALSPSATSKYSVFGVAQASDVAQASWPDPKGERPHKARGG